MGAMARPNGACARIGELVSLELDGELSELESARLDSHLLHCAQCASLKSELAGLTAALRWAPLERPPGPISLPRRPRFSLRPLQIGAAAATVAVAAGLAGLGGTVLGHASGQPHYVKGSGRTTDSLDSLRTLRR